MRYISDCLLEKQLRTGPVRSDSFHMFQVYINWKCQRLKIFTGICPTLI